MSSRPLTVTLRREKKVLAAVTLSVGSEPMLVGRAKECALRIPSDDYSASGVHAKVFWKRSTLMIEDANSRNGIFCDGVPLKKAEKLVPGSLYAIGGCLLSVKVDDRKSRKDFRKYHRLEFLNGEYAGRIVDIVPHKDGKEFDIGLDPACSVHLGDMLVSRRHAVLTTREDGECWIEDLGSRNGTYVNGEQLSGKKRLLKDGDKISVAFFDFMFMDRKVAHTRVHAWMKLAAVSITVCVMAALYVAWTASRQSVENYLVIARDSAAREDFGRAMDAAFASRNARDAAEYRAQIDDLVLKIGLWEKTCKEWKSARSDISANRLRDARFKLDSILSGPLESWAWNPKNAQEIKEDVDFAASALRFYFHGSEVIAAAVKEAKPDADIPVRAAIGPLEAFLRENADSVSRREYMSDVIKLLDSLLSELKVIRSGYDEIDASIARISAKDVDFKSIYADFDRISRSTQLPAAVRGYARQQLAPCGEFVKSQEFLAKETEALLNMDFVGVRQMASGFALPSLDLCIRHVKYSDARAELDSRHRLILHESTALQLMTEGLIKVGVTLDGRGDTIDYFLNQTNVNEALSFDCLNRRPPNTRRPEPVGVYDTMFGIESTYEALRALPRAGTGRNTRLLGFEPRCFKARQAFDRAETFVQYLDGEDRRYLQRGDVGKYYLQCVRITIERERMVQRLKEFSGSDRAEIVAGYYSDFFSSNPTDTAKRTLSLRFAKLRREIIDLGERYQIESDPEKQLALRDEIMAKGIPGDPVLHSKWAQKYD
jgi:pSer/pThr/pTyr-binding forkhead associated (FHA) protein